MEIIKLDENKKIGGINTTEAQNYPDKVWKKFLAYLTPKEAMLSCSLSNSSSIEEMKEIASIRERLRVASLLDDYIKGNLNDKDFNFVKSFFDRNKLRGFVRERMDEQLISTISFISSMKTEENISNYIDVKEKDYDKLDINEAYILFEAKEYLYEKRVIKSNQDLYDRKANEESDLHRHLIRDYGRI